MNPDPEFQQDCERLVAAVAIRAAETLPHSQRAMIYRGVISLLPKDTEERSIATCASEALETAERSQLRLFALLEIPSAPTTP